MFLIRVFAQKVLVSVVNKVFQELVAAVDE